MADAVFRKYSKRAAIIMVEAAAKKYEPKLPRRFNRERERGGLFKQEGRICDGLGAANDQYAPEYAKYLAEHRIADLCRH